MASILTKARPWMVAGLFFDILGLPPAGLAPSGCFPSFAMTCLASDVVPLPLPVTITTHPQDTEYLRGIMKETFDSIHYYRHPVTGFCCYHPENPDAGELTRSECLFLSLVSVAVAGKIGLLSPDEAKREVDKTLTWVEKCRTTGGFFWNSYQTADAGQRPSSDWYWNKYVVADLGFIYCSLAVIGEAIPEFKPRTDKLLKAVQWGKLYNEQRGLLANCIGLCEDDTITTEGVVLNISGDCRPGIFMAIASGLVPARVWDNTPRYYQQRYGVKYLKPGEGMGYSEQPWAMGYFLDERGSKVGMSNANMVWGQICYAQDMGFSTWGWSSCLSSDSRYMGWGNRDTSWSILNSHAVAAAVSYYPNQVVKAFRTLEKLGMRKPIITSDGKEHRFGFQDSLDIDTGKTPGKLIPGLDQAIVFLSLANYLHDGVVWKCFLQNEDVRRGVALIEEYRSPKTACIDLYRKRDVKGPCLPAPRKQKPLIVDGFKRPLNDLKGSRSTQAASFERANGIGRISFLTTNESVSTFREDLGGVDLTHFNALKLVVRADKTGKIMLNIRISGEGGYLPLWVGREWKGIIVPLRSFLNGKDGVTWEVEDPPMPWLAMWHDRSHADELVLGPLSVQSVELKEISFLCLPTTTVNEAARTLRINPTAPVEKGVVLDSLDEIAAW